MNVTQEFSILKLLRSVLKLKAEERTLKFFILRGLLESGYI
jgi:hypothetical protein